jgi:hypothetical protein
MISDIRIIPPPEELRCNLDTKKKYLPAWVQQKMGLFILRFPFRVRVCTKSNMEQVSEWKVSKWNRRAVDNRFAPPVLPSGTVEVNSSGRCTAETEVVVKVGNPCNCHEKTQTYHRERTSPRLGLTPKTDIVVVKIGYLYPNCKWYAADWLLAFYSWRRRSGTGNALA